MDVPDWTAQSKGLSSHRGLWPLGLEPVGFAFASKLLPGLTNATTQIRYYSFFSWVFWTFQEYLRRLGRQEFEPSEQKKWLSRLENVMRAATLHEDPGFTGLAGVSRATTLKKSDRTLDVSPNDVPSGFVPALYSSSWRNLRCGEDTGRGVRLTDELGESLARAFHEGIRDATTQAERETLLSLTDEIPVSLVRRIAAAIRLRPVEPGGREHAELIELLFRTRRASSVSAWRQLDDDRSRSLSILLEIARQGEGGIRDRLDIHRVFASRMLPNGREFEVPSPYAKDFVIWQRYQERQYERVALYGFWVVVYQRIRMQPADLRTVCRSVTEDIRLSPLVADWLESEQLEMSTREALARVTTRLEVATSPGLVADELREHILSPTPIANRAGASLLLLLAAAVLWTNRREELPDWARNLHRQYGRERLDLDIVVDDLEDWERLTVQELVVRLIERYVLSQSLSVALEKFARGEYRFFIARDVNGFRVVRDQDPTSHLGYDQPRLLGAYSLMEGLGLVDVDDGYRITSTGLDLLKELEEHHSHDVAAVG